MAKSEKEIYKYVDTDTGQIYDSAQQVQNIKELRDKEENERKMRELKDRNPDFIQLYKGVSPEIIASIAGKSGQAIQVLMFFMQNMSNHNTLIISQKTIAETLGFNERAVQRSIKTLEEYGAIGIGKVGNANVYMINPSVAWQRRDSEKQLAIMKANVIFGKEESADINKKFQEAVVNAKNVARLNLKKNESTYVKLANPKVKSQTQQLDYSITEDEINEMNQEMNEMQMEEYFGE